MTTVDSSNVNDDQVNNNNNNNFDNNGSTIRVKQEPVSLDESNVNNDNDYGAMSNDQDDDEKTNLIVNYLPQHMTDEEFENLFKKFGSTKSCKIVRNRITGYSYGFGFVDFETHKQAIQAISELNGHELETKKIKVAFARPAGQDIKQANLYIKNVPVDWTQDDVRKVFEPYGNIIQVRVLGNNRGVAFVLYDLRKQAEDALEALNGKTVDGCETAFEIKFAADKKVEKGNNKVSSSRGSSSGRSRERGNRAGRNQNFNRNRDQQRQGQQSGQKSYFDRQSNHDDMQQQQNMRGGQYNPVPYGTGIQYPVNFNNMNGVGPVRQVPTNRVMNRYAPFQVQLAIQQPMIPTPAAAPIPSTQLPTNPAYGFPAQQQMIPFAMMPTQPMAPIQQTLNQPEQMPPQHPMNIYGAPQMPMGYAPVTQNAMNNIYSVASNNMNNAANMQPQIGQPMAIRNNLNSSSGMGGGGGGGDDGVTLFVYNIGPDADDNELRSMFAPYGQVVKCNVVRKTPGGETKGFGFVTLKDRDQANSAISGLNGSMRNGRSLQVSLKK